MQNVRRHLSFDVRRQAKQELEEIGFYLTHQLGGFNYNITTASFHHSLDNSTILRKIFDAKIYFKKGQTCRTLLPGQAVRDFMLQLTSYNALHLGEWAAKIQIFGFT